MHVHGQERCLERVGHVIRGCEGGKAFNLIAVTLDRRSRVDDREAKGKSKGMKEVRIDSVTGARTTLFRPVLEWGPDAC